MNNAWEQRKLGEVCEFENGDRGKNYPSRSKLGNSGIPFINAGNITETGIANDGLKYMSREQYNKLSQGKIKKGDILFCLRGSLGKYSLVKDLNEGAIASSLVIVRTSNLILKEYLAAYFGSQLCRNMINKYSNGAAQPNLSAKNLKDFEIPLPPIPEQKRIVAILDKAFAAIDRAKANAEKNLANAKELFESYLNKIFANPGDDWETKKLIDVCENIFAGGDVPKKNFSKIKTENFNVPIFSNGIKDKGLYGYTDIKKVTKPSVTISARGTIGYSEIREESFYPVIRLIVLVPNNEIINLSFLHYGVSNIDFSNSGTSIPQLTVPMVKKYHIPVPPIPEQKRITKMLDVLSKEIKKLETIYQQKLADLEELKKSILQKAFNGEL